MQKSAYGALIIAVCFALIGAPLSRADEFSSSDFKVLDPVVFPAGFSNSSGYNLFGTVSQGAIGTSTSAGFSLSSGFLFFPFASTPAVAITAGDEQVTLTWSASSGYLGWTVSGYGVGRAAASGGPYTFSEVGNVLSNTQSGLTNGTTYYFVVRAEDIFGNSVATSTEVSAAPSGSTPAPAAPSSGGGGGGGGGNGRAASANASVNFSGRAYPMSKISLLKDGQIVMTTVAGPDANFSATLTGLSEGNYVFSVHGEDNNGNNSTLFSFPVYLTSGSATNISGIFIAPTISVDKSEVKRGDNIAIFGQSAPSSNVTILINSSQELFATAKADENGVYLYNLDTSPLEEDTHFAKSKALSKGAASSFGKTVSFIVGGENVALKPQKKCPEKGDLNGDCRVDFLDFSIAAFWYKRDLSGDFTKKEAGKLNDDGKLNLVDFSIMAHFWTG